jgi:choline dehydrogenase-like flavoprotein
LAEPEYDVVIVGAGICGAILAKELGRAGKKVLVLEAGRATSMTPEGYRSYLENYYTASAKVPNSPYPDNPKAPAPSALTLNPIRNGIPDTSGYLVQTGPLPFGSDYLRTRGGTTLHWLGTCLRMLHNDFRLKSLYGRGVDWPITYEQLRPYYEKAEWEIGVSADREDQQYHGLTFNDGYSFPMQKIPQSYLDRRIKEGVIGLTVPVGGREHELQVVSTPQGRNSTPNRGYTPVGMVGEEHTGERCEGNASCVPICPVQAKYSALKTLDQAPKNKVHILTQAVASKIELDAANRLVTGITYKRYDNESLGGFTTLTAKGAVYVIAAHAIETAKLLLASKAALSSHQVGRNLMDHPTLLTWGLMPEPIGSFRGPGSTSNIPTFRDGEFRKEHAAFIVPIDNWGWSWAQFSPFSDLSDMVDQQSHFGRNLRQELGRTVPRQFSLQFEFEQLPDPENRVTVDPQYTDALDNHRPIIQYDLSDYTRSALAVAKAISDRIFIRLHAADHTKYWSSDPGYLSYGATGYTLRGAGHLVGTHRMGTDRSNSVVNGNQQTWDHPNLYLVGCGNMPTLGTSNPTLTIAALAFWAAKSILQDLQ